MRFPPVSVRSQPKTSCIALGHSFVFHLARSRWVFPRVFGTIFHGILRYSEVFGGGFGVFGFPGVEKTLFFNGVGKVGIPDQVLLFIKFKKRGTGHKSLKEASPKRGSSDIGRF